MGPTARSSHTVSAVDGKVYVYGGEDTPRHVFDGNLWCFAENEWRKVDATGDIPPARLGHSATALGKDIYFFGGRDGDTKSLADFHKFDTESRAWTRIKVAEGSLSPPVRSYHVSCALGGAIYLFGGMFCTIFNGRIVRGKIATEALDLVYAIH